VADFKVIGLTEYQDNLNDWYTGVVAVGECSGQVLWTGTVPAAIYGSWSSPAIDLDNKVVVVAMGDRVTGLALADGHEVWHVTAGSGNFFVNASPTIDQGVAYITDFPNGGPSKLYAIDTVTGQVKWQAAPGTTYGANTVAVTATRVLIVNYEGRFRTFDKQTGAPDVDVLISSNSFLGGVAAEQGAAYAVTYSFGGTVQTRLYKIDPADGEVIWSAVAPRTDTIPVVTGNLVLVSGGDGYSIMNDETDAPQMWAVNNSDGQFLWSTPVAGGWACQPVFANGIVYVPSLALDDPPQTPMLYAFDVTKTPQEPGFLVASTGLIDSSVAVASGNVYGAGGGGLMAFGPAVKIPGDANHNAVADVSDLLLLAGSWGSTTGQPNYNPDCDFNGDGSVDAADVTILAQHWGTRA
jgi:outer membrane protein assembly factor BamB